jgi:translation initiation factor 4A
LSGIYGYGFEKPLPLQQKAILPIIKGRDIIVQAQSGTGKTATFAIGTLQIIDTTKDDVQVLVLAPTRDLAEQIVIVYKLLGEYLNVNVQYVIGGNQVKNDIKNLESGVHIVVGTPGRILHMIKKNILKLNYLKAFVFDEADEMLSNGFLEYMKEIITYIHSDCRVNLFSATMPNEIVTLTNNIMTNPAKIIVKNEQLTLEGVKQYYLILKKDWKLETLLDIYKSINFASAIIFCNSKTNVEYIAEEMKKRGHMISCIHADLPMMERDRVMKEFRTGATRVMITTDLLGRCVELYSVSIVINYDFPKRKETYIHRIGRSGKFSKKGNVINFVTSNDMVEFEALQKYYNTTIEPLPSDLSEI